ncbi:MAG TPA: hypothetical protein VIG99_06495 [Myxococcaceae bacterium]
MGPEEISEQGQTLKATPILLGASCPMPSSCGPDFGSCTGWSAPSGCGASTSSIAVQYQTCFDAQGNQCVNVSVSAGGSSNS